MAISSILGAAVTVVDRNLVRIGGTQQYASHIGEKLSHTSFFSLVLNTGVHDVIFDSKRARACSHCERRSECNELADIAYPIFLDDKVAGVIGIVAFTEEQRRKLNEEHDNLSEFLKYMSMLIESKMLTLQQTQALESRLDEFVNAKKLGGSHGRFIGNSPAINDVLELIKKIRGSNSTILISGESGTGKDVLAQLIHDVSPRGHRQMVSINCAAIPETLVESELFGYEGGAFTGAKKQGSAGKFEQANESTLFLDEIGEMPLPVQTKLLRVLQEKMVQRVGGKGGIPVDVRVICATNKELGALVSEGKFRLDLYYRLNVIPIILPPLRRRKEDIPLFITNFIERYNIKLNKNINRVEDAAMRRLIEYPWPGNVRELKNIIEYLVNVVESKTITEADLPDYLLPGGVSSATHLSLKGMLAEHEKKILTALSAKAKNSMEKKELAQRLGISLATLYRKLSDYDIEKT